MKLLSKKRVLAITLILGLAAMAGCGGEKTPTKGQEKTSPAKVTGKVTASGSTALLPLLKAGQEEFYKLNDKVTINISGGGSFTGQKQVASGAVNIGIADGISALLLLIVLLINLFFVAVQKKLVCYNK